MPARILAVSWVLVTLLAMSVPLRADVVELKPDHPERYTVVKGDTLWDISARFLQDPWKWASVWKINEQIKNPHLIYPGDVVVLTYVEGKPQLAVLREERPVPAEAPPAEVREARPSFPGATRLSPRVHVGPLKEAIPTISPEIILPFLTEPLVVGKNELEKAGYVTIGLGDRVALGSNSEFYARGLGRNPAEYYQIFRQGNALRHPDSGELLGYEALYLGDAKLLEPGDPSKLIVTRVKQEILPTDRLLEAPARAPLPYYYPRAPQRDVEGRILSAINGLREFGPTTIVAISVGRREGMEEGHVLRIYRHAGQRKDPVTRRKYMLPDEESGLLMVFRVFEKVSYALIMDADRPIHLHDALRTP